MRSIITIFVLMAVLAGMAFVNGMVLEATAEKHVAESSSGNPKYSEVCLYASDMARHGRRIGRQPERKLGVYGEPDPIFRKYKFTDRAKSFLREQGYIASVSAVDIDNDGVEELLFRYTVGSGHCEDDEFFKKNGAGRFDRIEVDGLDLTGGRLCSEAGLSFFRYKERNYAYTYSSPLTFPQTMDLYSARQEGFSYECTVQEFSDKVNTSTVCKEPICKVIRRAAQKIVAGAKGGYVFSVAERPIDDPDSIAIDWNSLKPFQREGRMFSIDLDNDGIDELIIKQRISPADRLYWSILKRQAGAYRAVDPHTLYKNFKVLGTDDDYLFEDNLVFARASGKNYAIAIHFQNVYPKSCRLDIYVIEKGKASKIGMVKASFRRLENNLSYDKK